MHILIIYYDYLYHSCRGVGVATQHWTLSKNREIRRDDGCFDYNPGVAAKNVSIDQCHGMGGFTQVSGGFKPHTDSMTLAASLVF